jgi:paraquat-inducible protein B
LKLRNTDVISEKHLSQVNATKEMFSTAEAKVTKLVQDLKSVRRTLTERQTVVEYLTKGLAAAIADWKQARMEIVDL